MIRFVHVSDLHFGKSKAQDQRSAELLYRLKRKYHFRLETDVYLLVTGDITDSGTEEQYHLAYQALIPFMQNLLVVPGNHDYGPVGNFYSRQAAARFDTFANALGVGHSFRYDDPHVRVIETADGAAVMTIGLNSVKQTVAFDDWARGRIGSDQLAHLHAYLNDPEFESMRKIVYLHHRPHVGDAVFYVMELEDREALMEVLRGHADVVCFGHEGRMQVETDAPPPHALRVRSPDDGCRLLDANDSVARSQCYVIDVAPDRSIQVSVEDIGPQDPVLPPH